MNKEFFVYHTSYVMVEVDEFVEPKNCMFVASCSLFGSVYRRSWA